MTLHDFHNGLRVLLNLDAADLIEAGVFTEADWTKFRANPHKWMIACDDTRAAKLWALMQTRMKQ